MIFLSMGMGSAKNAPQIFTNGVPSMPGGRGSASTTVAHTAVGAGFGAIPTHGGGGGKTNPAGWFVAAIVCAVLSGYWVFAVGNARTEAMVDRNFAQSTLLKQCVNSAKQSPTTARRKLWDANKKALSKEWKSVAAKTPGAEGLANASIPPAFLAVLETKLTKTPATTVAGLLNAAQNREKEAFPIPYPALVSDQKMYDLTKFILLGATVLFAGVGGAVALPKRRPAFASAVPIPATATPVAAPALGVATSPRIAVRPTTTPFPPPPEADPVPVAPVIRGSIASHVAATASSSAEVTRLVKRLEELEELSGQLKSERDESRKELTWTQSALDDFKKRVSDATTLATASAAQSAGASEQRAAQAEARVTEAVEHINEALARAVQTEFGVSRAKELAQTAEERAAHAEARAQETQFQLQRAMERLTDLERLAAVTRMGAVGGPIGNSGIPSAPAALPAPDRAAYPDGYEASEASPIDSALAAAAKNAPRPAEGAAQVVTAPVITTAPMITTTPVAPPTPVVATVASDDVAARVTAMLTPTTERPPAPRLTTTKMSDIEAGLKLARSIRSRTLKPPTDTE
ncbi:MAG: hypothetical protein H7Y38_06290 [Armatimonadetes bacterium]|nr:hypothetical protein [Armatimonadota bacterium]